MYWKTSEKLLMDLIASSLTLMANFADACTGVVVGLGIIAASVRAARVGLQRGMDLEDTMAQIRLSLGRWLALSLELALAADILRSVVAPTWDEIGKLGAIAALRTILNFFLEKEIERGARRLALRAA